MSEVSVNVIGLKERDLGADRPQFKSQPHHLLASWGASSKLFYLSEL